MAIRDEVRILKTNTLEEFRQKSNELSIRNVGDDKLLDARLADKEYSFTATASQRFFEISNGRFEILPEQTIDRTTGVAESFRVGAVRVTSEGTELSQGLAANNFIVSNYSLKVTLTGSPSLPSEFVENAVLTQSGGFSGTLLSADSNTLRFKSHTGVFSNSQNLGIPHTDATKRIIASNISSNVSVDAGHGIMIELITPASNGDAIKIISTSLVDAVNEIQDDIGDISLLGTTNTLDVVTAVNELETAIRGSASDLVSNVITTTANDLAAAINEHDTEIGTVANLDDAAGYAAADLSSGVVEVQGVIGNKADLTTSTTSNIVAAINEVDANADASVKLTSSSTQTINSDVTFASGKTLDMRSGSLLVGGGAGSSLGFDTAFLDLSSGSAIRGLSFERSNHGLGSDVEIRINQAQVTAGKPARLFQVKGLNDSSNSEVADLVTFYNAKELFANNTETGISVDWDSTNQNFDIVLTQDPTITLGGDLGGSLTMTNLAGGTLTATIQAGSVENSMLAGSIAASKLAGSIPNSKLSNSSITVSDGSNTSPIALGNTLTFSGTAGEVTVVENAGTVTVGLPDNVTVTGNMTINGNLDVNGTQTTINTATLEVDDTLILTGTSTTEPTTGGFGFETRSFSGVGTHANNASNVTGSHSIVYNFATDRWEADGSLILSEATLSSPTVEGVSFSPSKNLDFVGGSGISVSSAQNGNDIDITITNTLDGYSGWFLTVDGVDRGNIADDERVSFEAGTFMDVSYNATNNVVTYSHEDTGGSFTGSDNSGNTVIQDISVDSRGHINGVGTKTFSYSDFGNTDSITEGSSNLFFTNARARGAVSAGSGITYNSSTGQISTSFSQFVLPTNNVTQASVSGNTLTLSRQGASNVTFTANNYSFPYTITQNNNGNTVVLRDANGNFSAGTITATLNGNASTASTAGSITNQANSATITASTTAGAANTIVQRNSSGYIFTNYLNMTANDVTSGVTQIAVETGNDGYLRWGSAAAIRTFLNVANGATAFSGNTYSNNMNQYVRTTDNVTFSAITCASVSSSGEVTAFASDDRLKNKIGTIDNALDKVSSLTGFYYTHNEKGDELIPDYKDKKLVGLSAQDVEKVLPEVVRDAPFEGDYKTIQYEKVVPLLVEAIKELKQEIEELKGINS